MNGTLAALSALAAGGSGADELIQAIHGQESLLGVCQLDDSQIQSIGWHLSRGILTGTRADDFREKMDRMTDDAIAKALSRIRATGSRSQWQEIEDWAKNELVTA